MKKWLHSILVLSLAPILIIMTSGLVVIKHHCNHCNLDSYSFFSEDIAHHLSHHHNCTSPDLQHFMEKHHSQEEFSETCCSHKLNYFKLGSYTIDKQSITQGVSFHLFLSPAILINVFSIVNLLPPRSHAPPYTQKNPLHLLNCIFRN